MLLRKKVTPPISRMRSGWKTSRKWEWPSNHILSAIILTIEAVQGSILYWPKIGEEEYCFIPTTHFELVRWGSVTSSKRTSRKKVAPIISTKLSNFRTTPINNEKNVGSIFNDCHHLYLIKYTTKQNHSALGSLFGYSVVILISYYLSLVSFNSLDGIGAGCVSTSSAFFLRLPKEPKFITLVFSSTGLNSFFFF